MKINQDLAPCLPSKKSFPKVQVTGATALAEIRFSAKRWRCGDVKAHDKRPDAASEATSADKKYKPWPFLCLNL